MIRIHFLDSTSVAVSAETPFVGIHNCPCTDTDSGFYVQQHYNALHDKKSRLSTVDERLGILGFLLSHPCFMLKDDEYGTIYFTSAIKAISVE